MPVHATWHEYVYVHRLLVVGVAACSGRLSANVVRVRAMYLFAADF